MYSKYVLYLSKWFDILFHFLVNVLQFVFSDEKLVEADTILLVDCKKNTLGKALVNCLQKHKLQLVPIFKSHDVKHILIGYKMTIVDEILLQCYMIGNGNKSPVSIGIAALGLHFPHLYKQMLWHYHQGKMAISICELSFYDIVNEPIDFLRKKYGIKFLKNMSY